LEGSVVQVPPQGGRKHPEQKMVSIDTKNILFICGGAFDNIDKKIAKRLQTQTIGYRSNASEEPDIEKENLLQYISPQDIKAYGLIPELIGRLPILTHLDPLDKAALKRILTEPKNSIIKQYQKLFEIDGIKLTVEKEALDFIVEKAVEYNLGARGLRSICEAIMIDDMFELPSKTNGTDAVNVTVAYAKKKLKKSTLNKLKAA
jgi:ATP-dependent Clp protease ATP-binding subunit ClpX